MNACIPYIGSDAVAMYFVAGPKTLNSLPFDLIKENKNTEANITNSAV